MFVSIKSVPEITINKQEAINPKRGFYQYCGLYTLVRPYGGGIFPGYFETYGQMIVLQDEKE